MTAGPRTRTRSHRICPPRKPRLPPLQAHSLKSFHFNNLGVAGWFARKGVGSVLGSPWAYERAQCGIPLDPQGKLAYVNSANGVTRDVNAISGHSDWLATDCPARRGTTSWMRSARRSQPSMDDHGSSDGSESGEETGQSWTLLRKSDTKNADNDAAPPLAGMRSGLGPERPTVQNQETI